MLPTTLGTELKVSKYGVFSGPYLDTFHAVWFSKRHKSWLCFSIGSPRFFLRVADTMILKRFVKLEIIVYFRIW